MHLLSGLHWLTPYKRTTSIMRHLYLKRIIAFTNQVRKQLHWKVHCEDCKTLEDWLGFNIYCKSPHAKTWEAQRNQTGNGATLTTTTSTATTTTIILPHPLSEKSLSHRLQTIRRFVAIFNLFIFFIHTLRFLEGMLSPIKWFLNGVVGGLPR